jgi:hypothetical protein
MGEITIRQAQGGTAHNIGQELDRLRKAMSALGHGRAAKTTKIAAAEKKRWVAVKAKKQAK